MKKVKIRHRLDNAVAAFFAAENSNEDRSLIYANNFTCPQHQKSAAITEFAEKGDLLLKILKRTFLFFPGTFILFALSFIISSDFVIDNFHPRTNSDSFVVAFIYLLAGLLTWYGIGSLRNSKHFVIPLSIAKVGTGAGRYRRTFAIRIPSFDVSKHRRFYIFPPISSHRAVFSERFS